MLEIISLKLSDIKPYKNNAKLHPQEQIEQIKKSIAEFGMNDPIAVDENNVIIEGHGRLIALQQLNYEESPCIRLSHLSEEQKRAYILAHNKLTLNTNFDVNILLDEFDFLKGAEFDVNLTGFTQEELDEMFSAASEDKIKEDDFDIDTALTEPTVSQNGDIWLLGRHRLLCGDSTNVDDVATLMESKKANLCVTDPPYNCSYEGGTGMKIMNDNMSGAAFKEFLLKAFTNIYNNLADGGAFYCFHSDTEKVNFFNATVDAGFHYSTTCIWVKNSLVIGRMDYQMRHEPVIYSFKDTVKHKWYSDRKQTTIWEFDRPTRSKLHPTTKPVALVSYPIANSSQVNGIVLDLFGGSGSTMISCEQLDRICYMMELDPKYVDVIVKRYIAQLDSDDTVYLIRNGEKTQYKNISGGDVNG